jgi:hypothetical protein
MDREETMGRLVTILGVLAVALVITPSIALGECDGPFPSFEHAAPSARRIVIGQVIATLPGADALDDGRTSRFVLRGWSVLESDSPVEIDVADLQSQPCAGYIVARPGDRIAIAFEGHDFAPAQVVNAVAWLQGDPPRVDGIESTTIGAIYALLGRVPPVLASPSPTEPGTGPFIDWPIALAVLVAGVSGLGVFVWRRRPR